ncbi:MAG: RNA polymerase factor sigma-32 [Deltaproteobacteria bacterium]|nr:RNA polymerase factor sigma-32 [Deltaproteobacteria bacterium]
MAGKHPRKTPAPVGEDRAEPADDATDPVDEATLAGDKPEAEEAADEALGSEPEELMAEVVQDEEPEKQRVAAPLVRTDSIARYEPLQAYMQEVMRHPVLSADEQHALAVKFAQTGDVAVAATLVTTNLRLVVKIAYEYRRAHKNLMDLIQEGNIGLMQAVKRYDPYRGVKLSSYAAWWIRAYMLRYILNNARLVKVGTTQAQRKLFFNLAKEKARLSAMGIEPDPETIASNLNVSAREVEEMDRRIGASELSIDAPIGTGDYDVRSPTRGELLRQPGMAADDEIIEAEFNDALHAHLDEFGRSLQGKDRTIFFSRLIAEQPMTLQEIGDKFGISRERVRQLESRLQDRLKHFLLERMGEYLPFEA